MNRPLIRSREKGAVALIGLLGCITAGSAAADARLLVTHIDGTSHSCRTARLSNDVWTFDCPQQLRLPIDEVRSIEFPGQPTNTDPPRGSAVFHLDAGGRLTGSVVGRADEAVIADLSVGKGIRLPFSALAGIRLNRHQSPDVQARFDELLADRRPGRDVVLAVRNGKPQPIRGGLLAFGPDGGTLYLNRKEHTFDIAAIAAVVLATGPAENTDWNARVRLLNGDSLAGRLLTLDTETAVLETPFASPLTLPLERIASMSFSSDRIVFLTDLAPARTESAGLLHKTPPPRFDRSVSNRPLTIDGVVHPRGIGVQARTVVEFQLDRAYQKFAATIGIDDAVRPAGSVVFRVESGSRVLFDSGTVTGRDAPRNITIDVADIDTLALVVDFADGFDLSDHANWCDARLIKPPPKP